MPGEIDTLADFVARMDGMLEASKSGQLANSLYHMGCSAETLRAFHPERMQREIRRSKAVISSMTLDESSNPDKISDSRLARIASGSGVSVDDVRELLTQFRQMSAAIRKMNSIRRQR